MLNKFFILIIFAMFLLFAVEIYTQSPPPEIAMIILMENKFENAYRTGDYLTAKQILNDFIKDNVNDLKLKIDSDYADLINQKYNNLSYAVNEQNIHKIENKYIDFKNNLYLLYNGFDLHGISPELNFLIFDLNQLQNYYGNKEFIYIVYESNQIIEFINLIQKRLIEKEIFIPEVKYLYNYIIRLLNQIRAAALDADSKTLKEHIDLLEVCFEQLKISYETKKIDWNFNR